MKKLIAIALLLFIGSSIYLGCKKGPEDPFISFVSRKKRVIGKWEVIEHRINNVDTFATSFVRKTPDLVGPCGDKTETWSWTERIIFNFSADGRYDKTVQHGYGKKTTFKNPTANPSCIGSDSTFISMDSSFATKGQWNLSGGVGGIKKQEQIVLYESLDGVNGTAYNIIECSTKELKFTLNVTKDGVFVPDSLVVLEELTLKPYKP